MKNGEKRKLHNAICQKDVKTIIMMFEKQLSDKEKEIEEHLKTIHEQNIELSLIHI